MLNKTLKFKLRVVTQSKNKQLNIFLCPECHNNQKSHHKVIKIEVIRIDEADLQRGVHNTKSAKIRVGVLQWGQSPPHPPTKKVAAPAS